MDKIKKGVRLDHISKIYQDPKTGKDFYAVKDTSLTIEPGSFVTLLGPSGCGKTTTLRMIAGFESPDAGEIYLGGEPINELTPNKRDTAMVFQSYALLPHYNVFDNVAYGLKLRHLPKEEIREKVMRRLLGTYLGIWHMPHTDAPYVCIEPWASLPSRQDVVEELSCKSDLIHLAPGAKYENQWSITITEEKECMM